RAAPHGGRQVRDVVGVRVRLQRKRLDLELRLRPEQTLKLRLVERLVVEPPDVADERCLERRLLVRRRTDARERHDRDERSNRYCERSDRHSAYLHVPSLRVSLPP